MACKEEGQGTQHTSNIPNITLHPAGLAFLWICVGCVMLSSSCDSKLCPQVITAIPLPLVETPLVYFQDRKKGIEIGACVEAQTARCIPYLSGIQMWGQRRLDAGCFSRGRCGDDAQMRHLRSACAVPHGSRKAPETL